MKIAMSGATGFIGKHLSDYLNGLGYEVIGLGREYFGKSSTEALTRVIAETDIVINLAGAPINRRWTSQYKQILCDSRIIPTRMLVDAINQTSRVQLFISASAVGYYPSKGCYDELHTEKGDSFLSDLCESWESEVKRVRESVRWAITRFGVVLAADGGAFVQLVRPARMGMATIVASGKQSFSWIALTDLMSAMAYIIRHPEMQGVYNFVAPEQIDNTGFTEALARYYHTAAKVKIPAFFFSLLYGEGAKFLTEGQCVSPVRLQEAGFQFETPTIVQFLKNSGL